MLLCAFGRRPLRAGFFGSAASFAGFSCTGFSSAGAASFFALVLLVTGFLVGFDGFSSAGFSSSFSSAAKASFSVFFFGRGAYCYVPRLQNQFYIVYFNQPQ